MKNSLIIRLDFDGTCVTHEYPNIGKDIGAIPVLKRLIDNGHRLMLWTMRGDNLIDGNRNTLEEACLWFKENDIPLWGINENPEQIITVWTNSNKQFAHLYLDDAAIGAPLKYDTDGIIESIGRPYIDWKRMEVLLEEMGILK